MALKVRKTHEQMCPTNVNYTVLLIFFQADMC
jgi:hypothetical protein